MPIYLLPHCLQQKQFHPNGDVNHNEFIEVLKDTNKPPSSYMYRWNLHDSKHAQRQVKFAIEFTERGINTLAQLTFHKNY